MYLKTNRKTNMAHFMDHSLYILLHKKLSSHSCLGHASNPFSSAFPTKIVNAFFISPVYATFPLHLSLIILMRWVERNVYKTLNGKPEEKRLLRRSRYRWANNIKTVLRETVEGCRLESSGSGVGSCEHGNKPSGSIKCGKCLE